MDTKILVIQTVKDQTNLFICGASSAKAFFKATAAALHDVEKCQEFVIDDIHLLAEIMTE